MKILYETKNLIVVVKPAGVLSEESGNKQSVPLLLRRMFLEKGAKDPRFFTVHRLDRDVGGVMVLAKNSPTAGELSAKIAARQAEKEYFAVVKGLPPEEGVLEDLLFRDSKSGKTYVVDRMRTGVKEAKLSFVRLGTGEISGKPCALVRVRLYTGRTHQNPGTVCLQRLSPCGRSALRQSGQRELPGSLFGASGDSRFLRLQGSSGGLPVLSL